MRHQWNALVDRVDQPQVFYTYEWALAVQKAYHETLHPLLVLGYDGEESLCGVAALATGTDNNEATFLCATTGDYCDFVSTPERKMEFVGAALEELSRLGIKRTALANLPADSATLAAIQRSHSRHRYSSFARTAYVCAQVAFSKLERDKKGNPYAPGLKRLRRFEKAMGPEAPVRTEHRRSWEAVEPVLPEFIRAHVGRFLETGRISNLADPRRRTFLSELGKLLAQQQWLVVSRMTTGERPVAWHYGFQFHGSWFWYQPTFDSVVDKHWPGFCLLSQVIQDAVNDPAMTVLDLGLGSEAYKAKFANDTRETLYVTLHRSTLDHWQTVARYRAAAAVKTYPGIERLAENARQRFRGFKDRVRGDGWKASIAWAARRLLQLVWARDEVFFYELTNPNPNLLKSKDTYLQIIDLRTLAMAAIQNAGDEGTLAYLLRCAHRLRTESDSTGYVLTDSKGELLHFTWARPFEGFFWSELGSSLPSPAPDSFVLFDSWTPRSQRGRGHYGPTLGLVVARIRQEGKRSWGFSASTNTPSVRGLEKAGFRRCFSEFRLRFLWWQKIVRRNVTMPDSA